MAYEDSYSSRAAHPVDSGVNVFAASFVLFASMMMILMGSFHIMAGLAAVIDDTFYVVRPGFGLEIDVSTWGWVHMIGGVVVIFAAIGLFTGSVMARVFTLVIACLSVFWNFYSIPYYPVWSILMIVFGIGVLWALMFHGHEFDVTQEP